MTDDGLSDADLERIAAGKVIKPGAFQTHVTTTVTASLFPRTATRAVPEKTRG